MFVCTDGKEDLTSWLTYNGESADIYVIGFQEIVDLNAKNLVVEKGGEVATALWETYLAETLQKIKGRKYYKTAGLSLVGLSILSFVDQKIARCVTDVQTSKTKTGIAGLGGNKGAVCIRMNIQDTTLCFVNAHLAAHVKNCKSRNDHFDQISKNTGMLCCFSLLLTLVCI